jgi:exonuclease VII small subunit
MAQHRQDETVIHGQQRIGSYNPFEEEPQAHDEEAVMHLELETNPFEAIVHRGEFYQVNLDIMRRRFNVSRGFFGRAASFFAEELNWWQKGLIGLLIAGAAALVGLAISVAWVIALPIIAFALYAGVVYLFENYAQEDKNRFEHLTEEVIQQQQFMQEYHEKLITKERGFQVAIENINLNNKKLNGIVENYKNKEQRLDQSIKEYQEAMQDIQPLRDKIRANAQSLQHTESQFSEDMAELTGRSNELFHQLNGMAEQALRTTKSLQQSAASLIDGSLNAPVEVSTNPLHKDLEALINDYPFINDEDRVRSQAEAQERRESLRADRENISKVDEMIKYYWDSLAHKGNDPSITTSEQEYVFSSPRAGAS